MSLSWLTRLIRPPPFPSARTRRRRWPRPRLEELEDRCLLATVTTLLDDVPGSLREAIALTEPGGTVDFEPGLTGTITLTAGQLTLDKDLTIAGPGAGVITVSGNNASRVFQVTSSATAVISGLTIANGTQDISLSTTAGGGIHNAGTLTVVDSTISGNRAINGIVNQGGGIWSEGTLTVIRSTISGNGANGFSGSGGGIWNSGLMTVIDSTISVNTASPRASGGGIANTGMLTVINSTISGNQTQGGGGVLSSSGGGIGNSGTLTVIASTLSGNLSGGGGGGFGAGISNVDGTVTVIDSTLSGNQAIGGGPGGPAGGGIRNLRGTLTVIGSTLTDNLARTGGGISTSQDATVAIRNTILAGNTAFGSSPDVSGSVASQGHNLIGIGDGGSGFHPTDLVGTAASPIDPLLGPLADNGGPTLTHLPLSGSPVLNAGDNVGAPETDQRGLPRVVGGVIDIGAVEVQSAVPSVVVNDGAAQRSLVTSLTVTFTGPDSPAPDAFEVRRQDGSLVDVTVVTSLVGGQAVAVLTFAGPDVVNGSLADGRYTLTIRGAGEGGGDFIFGDDPTEAFFRRYGDVNGDGLVTAEILFQVDQPDPIEYGGDFGALVDALGRRAGEPGYVDFLDFNGDGVIDTGDLAQYRLDEVRSTIQ